MRPLRLLGPAAVSPAPSQDPTHARRYVGSGDTWWPVATLGRRQVVSSRHSTTDGHRVMRARLVFWRSGASGMGANAVDKKFGVF